MSNHYTKQMDNLPKLNTDVPKYNSKVSNMTEHIRKHTVLMTDEF